MLEKFVKTFLDILVLTVLNNGALCGYEILAQIHEKLNVLISPGTLYPLLHMLEKKGIIESRPNNRKKDYELTRKGLEMFKASSNDFKALSNIFLNTMSMPPPEDDDEPPLRTAK
jgi:DNA-binding PadR family transcriptional regulator